MSDFEKLVGKTVTGIYVNDCEDVITFETISNVLSFKAEGDCCSETWFADFTGVTALLGNKILSVEDVEDIDVGAPQDSRCRQDEDVFYGVRFKTDAGTADLIYRNSSNGYYGGNANYTESIGDYTQYKHKITDDWSAQ